MDASETKTLSIIATPRGIRGSSYTHKNEQTISKQGVENVQKRRNMSSQTPNHTFDKDERKRMFSRGFLERRDLEQYFWTEKTLNGILQGLRFTFDPDERCCVCTPSLAHACWVEGEDVALLDIDTRFAYLPKFRYFDLRTPGETEFGEEQDDWRVLVFDPPFFYISLENLFQAVAYVCKENFGRTKLLLGFLKREEKSLLETFKVFNLKRTNFELQYSHVKPNKWINYAMYSNVDLPGIKRLVSK